MANAKKCDICGKMFCNDKLIRQNKDLPYSNFKYFPTEVTFRAKSNGNSSHEVNSFDICKTCAEEFMNLIKLRYGVSEEREE